LKKEKIVINNNFNKKPILQKPLVKIFNVKNTNSDDYLDSPTYWYNADDVDQLLNAYLTSEEVHICAAEYPLLQSEKCNFLEKI